MSASDSLTAVRTINEVFYSVIGRNLQRAMLYRRDEEWIPISSLQLYRNVVGVARALRSWGIVPGDRIAILAENRPEWATADFAAMLIGAVTVPIYPTLIPDQIAYMLKDSGTRVIFVSTQEQFRKLAEIACRTQLDKIVMMDSPGRTDALSMTELMRQGPQVRDAGFDAEALAAKPDDLATLIYTSGTTGTPKGAMLTQGNLASNLLHSLDVYKFRPDQIYISFLPLSHITARHVDYAMFWHGVTIAYCPSIEELPGALAKVRPHFFVAVPRVYEKIYTRVQGQIPPGLKRKLYNWAIGVGRAHHEQVLEGKTPLSPAWRLANLLVFSKIKKVFGGRVRIFISGGAPLNRETIDWYASIGVRIFEGYGLTETSPVVALNNPRQYRAGSVGQTLKNLEVRIAEDGEILVRGPSVFKGYWNLPEVTEQAFDGNWFRTGDIGRLDAGGFLHITDRKKDLIKTSGGKFITPQPIEARLKANELIAEAAVIGERRKFPSVIIAPNFPLLENWAQENQLCAGSREAMVADPRVQALFRGIVDKVNSHLAQFEKIKKLLLICDEFTIANGALTPTMKLRRRVIEERYRRQLDELYESADQTTLVA